MPKGAEYKFSINGLIDYIYIYPVPCNGVVVVSGQPAALPCGCGDVRSKPVRYIKWQQFCQYCGEGGKWIMVVMATLDGTKADSVKYFENCRHGGAVIMRMTGELHFASVNEEDAGVYICHTDVIGEVTWWNLRNVADTDSIQTNVW